MMAPVKRGWAGALLDRYYGWCYGLPSESCTYTIDRVHIPAHVGISLAADLYQPVGRKPIGTILIRSPYGIGLSSALGGARLLAARGYQVLYNSCRGTGASTGVFEPARHEAKDGLAVVEWMQKQPWYTGSFATMGGSYLGYVQWALLSGENGAPEDMKAAVIMTGPHDFSQFSWGTGALDATMIYWGAVMTLLKSRSRIPTVIRMMQLWRMAGIALNKLPLRSGIEQLFKEGEPAWLREALLHQDLTDPFWDSWRHSAALEKARLPILLVSGWYDIMLPYVMEQYAALSERGCPVALKVGPWTHLGTQGKNSLVDALKWFEAHLAPSQAGQGQGGQPQQQQKQQQQQKRQHPFTDERIYVTGADKWVNLPKWPPLTSAYELWLSSDKLLSHHAPPSNAPMSTAFEFNPAKPTPSVAQAENFAPRAVKGNPLVDTVLAVRSDVATFTTPFLSEDVDVFGKPRVQLYHSSDHPNVDLLVRLTEVDAAGKSYVISEKYLRLDLTTTTTTSNSGEGNQPRWSASKPQLLDLELRDCAHRFRKGKRIRLLVAGGAHPHFIRNLGTGEDPVTGSSMRRVRHVINHGADTLSKLLLPVTPAEY